MTMDTDIDELEPRGGNKLLSVALLPEGATQEDMTERLNLMIEAINAQAAAARTHSIELAGIRLAMQAHGTIIETTLRSVTRRIEAALSMAGVSATEPAPKMPEDGE